MTAFTTWKFRRTSDVALKSVEDYIFFSADSALQLKGRWAVPPDGEMSPCGIPSRTFPSDHVNLVADFNILR